MTRIISLCFLTMFLLAVVLEAATVDHPAVYIDKGACPFECCTYRTWTVLKDTKLYAKPDKNSRMVGQCRKGTNIQAVTGEVHTKAGKFIVRKKFETFKPGDIIWVYTYTGEGYFKVWFNGKFDELNLRFSPYGGSSGQRCEIDDCCDGVLEKKLESIWWIKIKTPDGIEGWTFEATQFTGQDRCS